MATINPTNLTKVRNSLWGDSICDSLLILPSENTSSELSTDDNIFYWLLNTILPNTALLISRDQATIFLTPTQSASVNQNGDLDISVFTNDLFGHVKGRISSDPVAVTRQLKSSSLFEDNDQFVDSQKVIELALIQLEENEMTRVRNAYKVASASLRSIYFPRLQEEGENPDQVRIQDISPDLDTAIKKGQNFTFRVELNKFQLAFPTALGQGSKVSTSFPPKNQDGPFAQEVNFVAIGIRYLGYYATISRHYFINGKPTLEAVYSKFDEARLAAIQAFKVGVTLGVIYQAFYNTLSPELQGCAPESLGGFCGVLPCTEDIVIKPDSTDLIPENSMLILHCHLNNVRYDKDLITSFSVIDLIQMKSKGDAAVLVSKNSADFVHCNLTSVEENTPEKLQELVDDNRTMVERTRNRTNPNKPDEGAEFEKEISKMKKNVVKPAPVQEEEEPDEPEDQEHISYANSNEIPRFDRTNKIYPHAQKQTVFFPIYGMMVPFHISTIKTVQEDTDGSGQHSTIRISFDVPKVSDDTATQIFVKQLTYSALGNSKFKSITQQIRNMKNKFVMHQKKKRDDQNLYEEEALVNRQNPPRLSGSIKMRPSTSDQNVNGTLEAHTNGFKYRNNRGITQLVMFKNIRLSVLHRSETELNTMLHFYLKKSVRVGNKPVDHITFYKQVVASMHNTENMISNKSDASELAEEEHDRQYRKKTNKEFKRFCDEVQAFGVPFNPAFESPNRLLAFDGIVLKQIVRIYLLATSLVSIVDSPPFVLMMEDVEISVFERVLLSLKYFDLVFVRNDWTKPCLQIVQIPAGYKAMIQKWLGMLNIKYFVRKVSYDWTKYMSELSKIGKDKFEKDGGWEQELLEEEEDSPESEAFNEEEADAEEDDSDEFDAAATDDDDEEAYAAEDSEDEEGKDWNALADEAAAHDRKAEMKDKFREKSNDFHPPSSHRSSSSHHHSSSSHGGHSSHSSGRSSHSSHSGHHSHGSSSKSSNHHNHRH